MPKIAINDTELYYQRDAPTATVGSNQGEQPILVLANGIFQRSEAWESLMPHLSGFSILRYDMRGQGRSAVPAGIYTPALHADDLETLLQTLGISRYCLLGLSNGGVVAQVHATRQPPGLVGLILLCTVSRLDPLIRAKVEGWRRALELGGTPERLQIALPWLWGRDFLERHPEILSQASLEQMLLAAPTIQAQHNLLAGFLSLGDLRPDLSKIQAPTLVLSGQEDLLFPPLYAQEIADSIGGVTHRILPKLGHLPPLENPSLLAQEVQDFLRVNLSG